MFFLFQDFRNNPLKIFAAHELGVIDPSMGTKMTVQVRSTFKFVQRYFSLGLTISSLICSAEQFFDLAQSVTTRSSSRALTRLKRLAASG